MSFHQGSADRVDDYFRALRHINRFIAIYAAQVVLTVGDENNRPAHRSSGRLFHQLVATGKINRIPHRGPASGFDDPYAGPEFIDVPGKILRYVPGFVKSQHKSAVSLGADNFVEKFRGCILFKLEAV